MSRLPTLLLFMTTKGQCGARMIYRATLDHLDRDLPLNQWGARAAHIKITPGEEHIADLMCADLERRGFVVETATAHWEKGMTHFTEYLKDQIKMSQHPVVCDNALVYWTDSDYAALCHRDPYPRVLARMCQLVESSPDILSARFLREEDGMDPVVAREPERDLFWSRDFNWQPLVMRSRDFYLACRVIQDHWAAASQMHGEALWREALKTFSRSTRQHAVWLPEYAQCANLGVPNHHEVAKRLNLQIAPNP